LLSQTLRSFSSFYEKDGLSMEEV